jgi:signal transduction histidine kinase/PAS domain-containing protein
MSRSQMTASHAVTVLVPDERSVAVRYAAAVAVTALAFAATHALAPMLQRAIFVLFWPAVIGAAWFAGFGPAALASVLAVLLVDYFLTEPTGIVTLTSPDQLLPLGAFLLASTSVALMTDSARTARRAAAQAAAQNAELAHEIELQAIELEQQLEESQSLSEELEQSGEELAERTAAAEDAEAFTRGVIESITEPFVVHDAEWRFRFINEPAAALFRQSPGASHEPPLGRVLWEVYPDIVGTVFEREMRRAATERRPISFEAFYPGRGEWIVLSCFPLADGGLATQWTDVTAKKRVQETEHYLARAREVLASSLDYETTLTQLAQLIVPELADWCAVHVLDGDTPRQIAVAHVDPTKAEWARELNRRYPPRADAPSGVPHVLRTGEPEIHPEITDDLLVAGAIDAEHLRLSRELGLRSAMIVPLLAGDRAIGALTFVAAESGRRYSERDLPLATDLARKASLAVENARLHREALDARAVAERSARVADRLYSLTARLSGAATPHAVAEAVLAEARVAFDAERGRLTLIDDDGDTARSLASFGYTEEEVRDWRTYSLRDSIAPTGRVVETGRGFFFETLEDAREEFPAAAAHLERLGVRTAVVLPIADGRVLAIVSMSWTTPHSLPRAEREFMELFASQCGQALGRALAFDAERTARERTERLQRVTAALASASNEREVARVVVSNLREVLEPRVVAMYHVETEGDGPGELALLDAEGMGPGDRRRYTRIALDGDTPIAMVVRSRESVFLRNQAAFAERYPHWPASVRASGSEAWAAITLTASAAEPLGAVALGFAGDRTFGDDARSYVGAIVEQAAQALERVRLREAERRAREAAEEANRAKTQFLATMSHELRTPLNAISGYAELLSLGLRGPITPEQQEDLGRIMRSQRHLLSVINDILNFARLEAGYVEYRIANVPVPSLIGDLESLIRPQLASKRLEFTCDETPHDVVVRADAEKVRQVLLNLLANAVKFTAAGGRVRVTCDPEASRVHIRVIDTGLGIPADRRAAIFEPFVQLHRTLAQPAEGTGLGLAISRDLARGMGGELSVESEPGVGSTFTLTLERVG